MLEATPAGACPAQPALSSDAVCVFTCSCAAALRPHLPALELQPAAGEQATCVQSNSELTDGPNQRLSAEDVSALKAEKHGEELLEAIQSGSCTFADKTEFSQEKWRKRKAKKYILHVTARRPTSQLISHVRCAAFHLLLLCRGFMLQRRATTPRALHDCDITAACMHGA